MDPRPEPTHSPAALRTVALYQRLLHGAMLAQVALVVGYVVAISTGLARDNGEALVLILGVVGVIGLVAMLAVNGLTNGVFRRHGVRVGLFGANRADIAALDERAEWEASRDEGW
ncbi:MAG: hypothetical protein K2X87_04560 [Gemmataceae bacterium]|nr:hypothetical protein [Gemmataceae bacterium]